MSNSTKAKIVKKKLTDGSEVYDVILSQDENTITIGCIGRQDAEMFLGTLDNAFQDFTVETLEI